jgi:hypothetical protein
MSGRQYGSWSDQHAGAHARHHAFGVRELKLTDSGFLANVERQKFRARATAEDGGGTTLDRGFGVIAACRENGTKQYEPRLRVHRTGTYQDAGMP